MPGLTTHALALLLPDGDTRWVSLFVTPPDPNGEGGVEVPGFTRAEHDAWTSAPGEGGSWVRSNNGAIAFDSFAFPVTAGRIEAVGVWDAKEHGNLLLWALCDVQIEDVDFADQVRFVTGALRFGSTT